MRVDNDIVFPGHQYRATHRASVVSILGEKAPEVRSYGSRFWNQDRWTLRLLTAELCTWAKKNPSLDSESLRKLVDKVNWLPVPKREIVIASTPDELSPRMAMALVGGAYHEAWHTMYSYRGALRYAQMEKVILPRWKKLRNWANLSTVLLEWSNVIEDIRIERRGNEQFGGTLPRMHDLQDFILEQERPLRESDTWTPLATLLAVFRDAGLGYVTDVSQEVFSFYKKKHPDIFALVVHGQLRPLLDEAISMSAQDSVGCLRLAMDVAILLEGLSLGTKPTTVTQSCSQCGAPASDRRLRPNLKTLEPLTLCLQCGHLKEGEGTEGEGTEGTKGTEGKGTEGEGTEGTEGEGTEGTEGEGTEGTTGEGTKVTEETKGTGGTKGTEGKGTKGTEGKGTNGNEGKGTKGTKEGRTGGSLEARIPWSPEVVAQTILILLSKGEKAGLQDFSSSMESAFLEQSHRRERTLQRGEQLWNPYTLDQDEILATPPGDPAVAQVLLAETRMLTSFLQARLRTLLLALRVSDTEHGHKKGVHLSARNLTSTQVSLREGRYPNRAFTRHVEGLEESFAGALILDQSGSMEGQQAWLIRCLFALALPLDLLGFPLFIAGFQDGHRTPSTPASYMQSYHRTRAVRFNVLKEFHSTLRSSLSRLVNIEVSGGTPMADGIQFGLQALRNRSETHRALFVLTDGAPDSRHIPVINWQTRVAKESGISIIGVGVGKAATRVCSLFEDSVWTPDFSLLPKALVTKLSMLISPFDQRYQKPLNLGAQAWNTSY